MKLDLKNEKKKVQLCSLKSIWNVLKEVIHFFEVILPMQNRQQLI